MLERSHSRFESHGCARRGATGTSEPLLGRSVKCMLFILSPGFVTRPQKFSYSCLTHRGLLLDNSSACSSPENITNAANT